MKFEDLGLAEPLLRAVARAGLPRHHQNSSRRHSADPRGARRAGLRQTGTGKTAAFALPTLQRLSRAECHVNGRGRKIRTLVLAPTRELALQICESFQAYGRYTAVRQAAIYGGVGQSPQVRALNQGVDVLIATPGTTAGPDAARLRRPVARRGADPRRGRSDARHGLHPRSAADRAKVPAQRQTLLFSATLPPDIRTLADQWLTDPVDVRVTPATVTVETIRQSVFFVDQKQKLQLLTHWLRETPWTRTLVFTRTKHGADKVAKSLVKAGIQADAFHSNKSQSARQRVLLRFKAPQPLVLVATDIAARGLDIDDVSHVVNFDLPIDADNYIHRIGRTGRAGAAGVAVSFCDHGERSSLQAIQRLTRQTLAVEERPAGMPAAPATQTPPGRPAAGIMRGQRVGSHIPAGVAGLMSAGESRSEGGNPGFQGSHADGHPGLKSA